MMMYDFDHGRLQLFNGICENTLVGLLYLQPAPESPKDQAGKSEPSEIPFALAQVRNTNAQGEYYLTDTLGILLRMGRRVSAQPAADPREVLGVNTPQQLEEVARIMQQRGGGDG